MARNKIKNLTEKSLRNLQKKRILPEFEIPEILVEIPEDSRHGDYSTNIAMKISRAVRKSPIETAKLIISGFEYQTSNFLDKVEVREPGFINFFLSKEFLQKQILEILKKKERFGKLRIGRDKKINVEFISANPTGPLHVGNARSGFCGDVLANVLNWAGYKVKREYYVNDLGRQIEILKNSLEGKDPSYKNPYIEQLKKRKVKRVREAIEFILKEIKKTVKKMGIEYDRWFYESSLKKETEKVTDYLQKKNLVYKKEGALWFSSTRFGDEKDRVLIRANGESTYFLSDIAYLKNKFKRGFDFLIMFLGAEHHGYAPRLKASAEALGYNKERLQPIIFQLVKLFEAGKEVKMSKRTGIYVTIDELIDEVGLPAARFFFLDRSYNRHLNFDLDLAKEQSENNPVYYVQYAYARICAILRKYGKYGKSEIRSTKPENLKLLNHPSELNLIKQLIRFPEIIEDTAKDYQVQRLPRHAVAIAEVFHQFYRDCRVLSEDRELTQARLALISAVQIVLKNTLSLMGIFAPQKM
jgi:arginyl-tRNA synthetase